MWLLNMVNVAANVSNVRNIDFFFCSGYNEIGEVLKKRYNDDENERKEKGIVDDVSKSNDDTLEGNWNLKSFLQHQLSSGNSLEAMKRRLLGARATLAPGHFSTGLRSPIDAVMEQRRLDMNSYGFLLSERENLLEDTPNIPDGWQSELFKAIEEGKLVQMQWLWLGLLNLFRKMRHLTRFLTLLGDYSTTESLVKAHIDELKTTVNAWALHEAVDKGNATNFHLKHR